MKYYFFTLFILLSACSEMAIKNSQNSKLVSVEGIQFVVEQRSDTEFIVIHNEFASNNLMVRPDQFASRKFLFEQAIEKSSGCKIKSSLLSPTLASLTAFVQCE
jgi:hypothetical protein